MTKKINAIAVLTRKSIDEMLEVGGSQAWHLDPERARGCDYVVCIAHPLSRGSVAPHKAFLVARLTQVEPVGNEPGRWRLCFDEYAEIGVGSAWDGGRNPVRYMAIEDLGISLSGLEWAASESSPKPHFDDRPLTISEAKIRLAATFGVPPEAIEITVRA